MLIVEFGDTALADRGFRLAVRTEAQSDDAEGRMRLDRTGYLWLVVHQINISAHIKLPHAPTCANLLTLSDLPTAGYGTPLVLAQGGYRL